MSVIVIPQHPANSSVDSPINHCAITKDDGTLYSYWHISSLDPDWIVYGDSLDDIADYICGTSPTETNGDVRQNNRVRLCTSLIVSLRRQVAWNMHLQGVQLEGWEKEVYQGIVRKGVNVAHGWGQGDYPVIGKNEISESPNQRDIWNAKIPLVLLDAHYYPYTDIMPPIIIRGGMAIPASTNTCLMMDAGSNQGLMQSLACIGVIRYGLMGQMQEPDKLKYTAEHMESNLAESPLHFHALLP